MEKASRNLKPNPYDSLPTVPTFLLTSGDVKGVELPNDARMGPTARCSSSNQTGMARP